MPRQKRENRIRIVTCLCLIACLLAGVAVYAATQGEIAVTNQFQTGSVDLELKTYSKTEEGEQEAVPGDAVAANQTISYIPRIMATRADCYVRLLVDIVMEKEIADPITLDGIELAEGWVQKGDLLYYTKPLKNGETVTPFETIHVPESWNGDNASGFDVYLVADAIQAANVTPDFESGSPWGTVEIEMAKEEEKTDYRVVKQVKDAHTLSYQGNGTFELSSKDLFENFSTALTGDTFKDSLKMTNHAGNRIKLNFKCECPDKQKLLEHVNLNLKVGEKSIYEGPLSAEKLSKYQEIAVLEPKQVETLNYELTVPEELKNEFSVEKGNVIWHFQAEEIDENGHAVQTGDAFPFAILLLVFAGTGTALLTILLLRRKRNKVSR